jgi:predicted AlkP superfamily pyrophosphatase or phosphodiesterase
VARVLWAPDLASTTATDDALIVRARKSYMAGRSGDITLVVKPNWMTASTGTTHGSPYDYDTHVPIAFMGAGIAPGKYPAAATPADIAPTLAALTGIKLPHADGHALREALAAPTR